MKIGVTFDSFCLLNIDLLIWYNLKTRFTQAAEWFFFSLSRQVQDQDVISGSEIFECDKTAKNYHTVFVNIGTE